MTTVNPHNRELAHDIIDLVVDRLAEQHPIIRWYDRIQAWLYERSSGTSKALFYGESFDSILNEIAELMENGVDAIKDYEIDEDVYFAFKTEMGREPTNDEILCVQEAIGNNFSTVNEHHADTIRELVKKGVLKP